jgi:hypothetical protein
VQARRKVGRRAEVVQVLATWREANDAVVVFERVREVPAAAPGSCPADVPYPRRRSHTCTLHARLAETALHMGCWLDSWELARARTGRAATRCAACMHVRQAVHGSPTPYVIRAACLHVRGRVARPSDARMHASYSKKICEARASRFQEGCTKATRVFRAADVHYDSPIHGCCSSTRMLLGLRNWPWTQTMTLRS